MAANQTSGIGVLFDVDYDVIVRNGCFQRGTTLKFLKYFKNFFYYNFWATPWSNDFLSTNKKWFEQSSFGLNSGGKSWKSIFFWFVLKARVGRVGNRFSAAHSGHGRQVNMRRIVRVTLTPPQLG